MRTLYFAAVVSIFFLLLSSSFFLAYSQPSQSGCLPYFQTRCDLSANLQCTSEFCCARLTENRTQKLRKYRHLRTIAQICRAMSSQLSYVSIIEKNMSNSNVSSTRLHGMGNCGSLATEIDWWVWGTPANFNGFRVFASLLHRRRWTEVNQTLHDVWPSPGLVHYIYIFGALSP